MTSVRYRTDGQVTFRQELNREIDRYFADTGQGRHGNRLMMLKLIFFSLWMIGGYFRLYSAESFVEVLIGYQLASSGAVLIVFAAAHDASHGALFSRRFGNRLASKTWYLVGSSHRLWKIKHDQGHHAAANVLGYDGDISQTALLRLNPADERRWFHAYQQYYAPALYLLFGVVAVLYRDIKIYRDQLPDRSTELGPAVLGDVVASKIVYSWCNVILPLLVVPLPAWKIFAALAAATSLVGVYTIFVLAAPHLNGEASFAEPSADGEVGADWYTHGLQVTVDSSPSSRVLAWFTGGLNTHVIHHLYPGICHIHYRRLTQILEAQARNHGVEYHKLSFPRVVWCHFTWLAGLGRAPSVTDQMGS